MLDLHSWKTIGDLNSPSKYYKRNLHGTLRPLASFIEGLIPIASQICSILYQGANDSTLKAKIFFSLWYADSRIETFNWVKNKGKFWKMVLYVRKTNWCDTSAMIICLCTYVLLNPRILIEFLKRNQKPFIYKLETVT